MILPERLSFSYRIVHYCRELGLSFAVDRSKGFESCTKRDIVQSINVQYNVTKFCQVSDILAVISVS